MPLKTVSTVPSYLLLTCSRILRASIGYADINQLYRLIRQFNFNFFTVYTCTRKLHYLITICIIALIGLLIRQS